MLLSQPKMSGLKQSCWKRLARVTCITYTGQSHRKGSLSSTYYADMHTRPVLPVKVCSVLPPLMCKHTNAACTHTPVLRGKAACPNSSAAASRQLWRSAYHHCVSTRLWMACQSFARLANTQIRLDRELRIDNVLWGVARRGVDLRGRYRGGKTDAGVLLRCGQSCKPHRGHWSWQGEH